MLNRILRAGEARRVRRLARLADQVEALSEDYSSLSDEDLADQTRLFRERLDEGEKLDSLLVEAFAVVREATARVLSQRHYHEQLMGGAALYFGGVAEMKTGEGKTQTALLPTYLAALAGKGVHVVTVNDYLASRDSEWVGSVLRFLGLSVSVVTSALSSEERRTAYAADVTYGTNTEFGFDYLRDNMALSTDAVVQRGHHFAIVDEVDSILIDEARTPLIISGPAGEVSRWYTEFARLSRVMRPEKHYTVDLKLNSVSVTEEGIELVEDQLGIENLYSAENTSLVGHLQNALKAKELFHLDQDYVIQDGEVLIVDEFTGRILSGRRYNEGMHQAIEAKEGVHIQEENQTLATITLQNYFRLYEKLAGMTGTAQAEAAELSTTYKLDVLPIPTHRPMIRTDHPDVVYTSETAKLAAVVEDIKERNAAGQPILAGTASVEKSELLSSLLLKEGIPHEVLNAKNHAREAVIVAQAGRKGALTVATNMAGRGTDILLGGSVSLQAAPEVSLLDPEDPEFESKKDAILTRIEAEVSQERSEVIAAGGLYVLGTERHDSRRIDDQLRGRSGRQGDPGESRFYLSFEDDLMKRFNADTIANALARFDFPEDQPITAKLITRSIRSAQAQVEGQNFETRKDVLKYDEVLSRQRSVVYEERARLLAGADASSEIENMIEDVLDDLLAPYEATYPEDWDLATLRNSILALWPTTLTQEDLVLDSSDQLRELLEGEVHARRARLEEEALPEHIREVERRILLSSLDTRWREHLYEMDYLRAGISLRAMAQRDPLVEYQREAFDLFEDLLLALKKDVVRLVLHLEVTTPTPEIIEAPPLLHYSGPTLDTPEGVTDLDDAAQGVASPRRQSRTSSSATPQEQRPPAPLSEAEAQKAAILSILAGDASPQPSSRPPVKANARTNAKPNAKPRKKRR